MKKLFPFLLAVGVLSAGCHSTSAADEVPCNCGTHEADMQGCLHSCARGERNPDNADCVCGNLTIPR